MFRLLWPTELRVLSGCEGRDRTYDQVINSHLLYRWATSHKVVPRIGLEPTRLYSREILSLLRLPISPPRLILSKIYVYYIYVPTLKSNSSPRHPTTSSAERNTPFFYYAETILLFLRARAISRGATFSQVPVNWFFMTNRFAWWPTTENAPVSGLRSSTTENRFGLRVRDSTFTVLFISFIILMLLLLFVYYYYSTIISVFLMIQTLQTLLEL